MKIIRIFLLAALVILLMGCSDKDENQEADTPRVTDAEPSNLSATGANGIPEPTMSRADIEADSANLTEMIY